MIFVYRVRCLTSDSTGNDGKNHGIISVTNNAEDTTIARVEIGDNQTSMAIYWVPIGKRFFMTRLYGAEDAGKKTTTRLYAAKKAEVFQMKFINVTINSHFTHNYTIPLKFEAGTKIEVRAAAIGGSGVVSAGIDGWLEDN